MAIIKIKDVQGLRRKKQRQLELRRQRELDRRKESAMFDEPEGYNSRPFSEYDDQLPTQWRSEFFQHVHDGNTFSGNRLA